MAPFALQARYVIPSAGQPPIPGGVVTIAGTRVLAVSTRARDLTPLDLGNVVLLPGLVNAHTHLEFSDLAAPLGKPGMPLPEWIRAVIAHRGAHQPDKPAAIAAGLSEASATGTVALGEIATHPWPAESLAESRVDVTVFLELLGLLEARVPLLQAAADKHLAADACKPSSWHAGLSPHAPYSLHRTAVLGAVKLAQAKSAPLAMHLAESREELELLEHGTGPFVELLQERGVWNPGVIPLGSRPLDYLQMLSPAPRTLVIHGNYLQREELELLAEERERMTLVYCPRTHAYFGHERYPLREALHLGVRVALGTDSRASNPDLNLLEEMRFLARQFPELAPEKILHMGTMAGAEGLGREPELGSISPGKLASFVAFELPEESGSPLEQILAGSTPTVAVWHAGQRWQHSESLS